MEKQLVRPQGHTRSNRVVWLRVRAEGEAFFQAEVLIEAIVPLLSPPPPSLQTQAGVIFESPSTCLTVLALP